MDNNFSYFSKVLHGGKLSDNKPISNPKSRIDLKGKFQGKNTYFGIDDLMLGRHILCMGGTGTGKTNFFKHCVRQLKEQMTDKDVMIIFDTKGDFYSNFFDRNRDSVIGNSRLFRANSERWNLFREIVVDGYDDQDVLSNTQELCRSLFSDREIRTNNPFFPNAARDLLAGIITTMIRLKKQGDLKKERINNQALKSNIDEFSAHELIDLLSMYPDMMSKAAYISGDNSQSQGVLSELYSVVNDLMIGVFNETGNFSVRNFIRQKGGKTLFIEYDMANGEILTPVYAALFDLALKETMSNQGMQTQGNVYLILDELKLLPNLKHLEDGINFGRSYGLKIIAGLQSVDQLQSVYKDNESSASNILSGFSSLVAFRPNDAKTRLYISQRFGENAVVEQYQGMDGYIKESMRQGHVVEEWDMIDLSTGEAIVGLIDHPPFSYQFDIYQK